MMVEKEVQLQSKDKNVHMYPTEAVGVGLNEDGHIFVAVQIMGNHLLFPITKDQGESLLKNLTFILAQPVGAA